MTQEEAVAAVASLLAAGLRPESLFALLSAGQAVETEGISGTLIIKIPRKAGPVDVQFTTGPTRIGLDV